MGKILVRKMTLSGDYPNSASEDSDRPAYWDVEETYRRIGEFLRTNAQPIIPQQAQVPFVQDGFIGSFAAFSCYAFNNCLLTNKFRPYFCSVRQEIQTASPLEHKSRLEATLGLLKEEAGKEWVDYWNDNWKETIIDVPGQLCGPVSCFPHFQKLLTR